MRKIIVSVMMIMMLCVGAYADVIYTTDAGNMGLIQVDSQTSADLWGTQYTEASGDLLLGSFWNGSKTQVILVNRNTTTSGDTALIFDPSNLTKPLNDEAKTLAGVYGTRSMAYSNNGRGLFFASGSSIYEFSTSDLSLTHSYTYNLKNSDDIMPKVTSLLVGTYAVYALMEREASDDVLFIFDGQLKEDVEDFMSVPIPSGTSSFAWLSNSRFAAAHEGGVDVMSRNSFVRMVSSDYPVKSLCQDADDGCYFVEQNQAGETYTTRLKHYSSSEPIILYTDDAGSACKVIRDEDNGVIAAMVGSKILVYSMKDDALLLECSSDSLGGLPTNIAMSYVSGYSSNSSSGCDTSSLGAVLLLSLMLLRRR